MGCIRSKQFRLQDEKEDEDFIGESCNNGSKTVFHGHREPCNGAVAICLEAMRKGHDVDNTPYITEDRVVDDHDDRAMTRRMELQRKVVELQMKRLRFLREKCHDSIIHTEAMKMVEALMKTGSVDEEEINDSEDPGVVAICLEAVRKGHDVDNTPYITEERVVDDRAMTRRMELLRNVADLQMEQLRLYRKKFHTSIIHSDSMKAGEVLRKTGSVDDEKADTEVEKSKDQDVVVTYLEAVRKVHEVDDPSDITEDRGADDHDRPMTRRMKLLRDVSELQKVQVQIVREGRFHDSIVHRNAIKMVEDLMKTESDDDEEANREV